MFRSISISNALSKLLPKYSLHVPHSKSLRVSQRKYVDFSRVLRSFSTKTPTSGEDDSGAGGKSSDAVDSSSSVSDKSNASSDSSTTWKEDSTFYEEKRLQGKKDAAVRGGATKGATSEFFRKRNPESTVGGGFWSELITEIKPEVAVSHAASPSRTSAPSSYDRNHTPPSRASTPSSYESRDRASGTGGFSSGGTRGGGFSSGGSGGGSRVGSSGGASSGSYSAGPKWRKASRPTGTAGSAADGGERQAAPPRRRRRRREGDGDDGGERKAKLKFKIEDFNKVEDVSEEEVFRKLVQEADLSQDESSVIRELKKKSNSFDIPEEAFERALRRRNSPYAVYTEEEAMQELLQREEISQEEFDRLKDLKSKGLLLDEDDTAEYEEDVYTSEDEAYEYHHDKETWEEYMKETEKKKVKKTKEDRDISDESIPAIYRSQLLDMDFFVNEAQKANSIDTSEMDPVDEFLANAFMEAIKTESATYSVFAKSENFKKVRIPTSRPLSTLVGLTVPDIHPSVPRNSPGHELASMAFKNLSKNYYFSDKDKFYMTNMIALQTNKYITKANNTTECDGIFDRNFRKGLTGMEAEGFKAEENDGRDEDLDVAEQEEPDWKADAVVDEDELDFDEDSSEEEGNKK